MSLELVVLVGDQPMPAPGAGDVEVIEQIGEPAWFRVRSDLPHVEGDFPTLRDGRLGPNAMLTIGTTIQDVPHVLCHGPVHGQRVHFEHGGTGTLELTGGDESLAMDREVVAKVWPDGKVSSAIEAILRQHGFTEAVETIDAQYAEADHALVQHDSDLRFVRRMARRYGCWFWLRRDHGTKTTHAYFKRPAKPPSKPAVAITINLDHPAVDTLDLEWDIARPTTAIAHQLGARDKQPIDGGVLRSPAPALGVHAFADVAPARTVRVTAPVDTAGDLRARSEAALIDAGWFIRVRGTTTARRLRAVLRAHDHVSLQGVGRRHSGTYVVSRVRHFDDAQEHHRMEFELVRNAWGD